MTGERLVRPEARHGTSRVNSAVRLMALVLVFLAPIGHEVVAGFSIGLLAALPLLPVWWRATGRWSGARTFLALVVVALLCGFWLTAHASTDHTISTQSLRAWTGLVLGLAVTVAVILWARTMFRISTIAVTYGLGLLVWNLQSVANQDNIWKSTLSMPLTFILLGLAGARRGRVLPLVLTLGLAATSALNDSRSHFAMVLLAAAAVAWQGWFRGRGRRRSATGSVLVIAVLGLAVYNLGQSLMVEGYLGEDTQARTIDQIERSGSILLGGRPELGATVALMAHRPLGFGHGTIPTLSEMQVAKSGMAALQYDPDNGYVHNYMFGGVLKLHSVIGDAWAMFGIGGLALVASIAWVVVRRLGHDLAEGTLTALMAYLCIKVTWDLLFGPLYSGLTVLSLAVGLLLLPRRARPPSG